MFFCGNLPLSPAQLPMTAKYGACKDNGAIWYRYCAYAAEAANGSSWGNPQEPGQATLSPKSSTNSPFTRAAFCTTRSSVTAGPLPNAKEPVWESVISTAV